MSRNCHVCKHTVTRLPHEAVRFAQDLSGSLLATMPSFEELEHPEYGPALRTVVGSTTRAKALRLVESMTYGAGSVPLRIECIHGAGSLQAQRIVLEREIDWDVRVAAARRLAGIDSQ